MMICDLCGVPRELEHVCIDALKLQNEELQKDVTSMKVAVRMHQTAEKKLDEILKEKDRLISEMQEYIKATTYWKIEPHDQKERAAWIQKLELINPNSPAGSRGRIDC